MRFSGRGGEMMEREQPKIGEYKGSPTITLPLGSSKYGNEEFTFGLKKARAIIEFYQEIRQFVLDHEK
jgi:hypothetical protein